MERQRNPDACRATRPRSIRTVPLQPLLEEADEARRHEAGVAAGLIDRVAQPKVRRALHDAGADEKVRLLQSQQKGVGVRLAA
jgi:hypothetical protein